MNQRGFIVVIVALLVLGATGALLGTSGQDSPSEPTPTETEPGTTTTVDTTDTTTTTTADDDFNRSEYHPEDPGTREVTHRYKEVASDNKTWNATVNTSRIESLVFEKINDMRVENGLEPWERSYRLASNSRAHSQWMLEEDNLSHVNSDGQRAWDRWDEMETERCSKFGENIVGIPLGDAESNANPYMTSNERIANKSMFLWNNSEPHKELILSEENYQYIGVGATTGMYNETSRAVVLVTMNVCEPFDGNGNPDEVFENSTQSRSAR